MKKSVDQQRLTKYDEQVEALSEVALQGGAGFGWVYDTASDDDGDDDEGDAGETNDEVLEVDSLDDDNQDYTDENDDDDESLVGEEEIRASQHEDALAKARAFASEEKEYFERDKQVKLKEKQYLERQAKLLNKARMPRSTQDGNVVEIDVTKVITSYIHTCMHTGVYARAFSYFTYNVYYLCTERAWIFTCRQCQGFRKKPRLCLCES